MNLNNYDYYGNYEENKSYILNVNDVHKKQMERRKKRLVIYNKMLENAFKRIKSASDKEEVFCIYQCPEYIPGYPIYNLTECVMHLLKNIKERGFQCRYIHPFIIFISWNCPQNNLLTYDNDEIQEEKKVIYNNDKIKKPSILDQLDLKYKSIEDYKPDIIHKFNI